jgi:hypothetical protein
MGECAHGASMMCMKPPCPLHLGLFAEEIEKREEKRRDRRLYF